MPAPQPVQRGRGSRGRPRGRGRAGSRLSNGSEEMRRSQSLQPLEESETVTDEAMMAFFRAHSSSDWNEEEMDEQFIEQQKVLLSNYFKDEETQK